jgi:hypothetical protein
MPDLTVPITDEEMHALRTITPALTTPEKMAGDLLGQSIQGGLDQMIDSLLESWVSLLSIRDLETMEHTRRVTEFTVLLASRMGFSDRDLVHIRRGALLHDIGKLGIPDKVLWKNGKLNADETILIRKHPDLAVQVLEPLEFLHPSMDIPHYHHERFDGSGYPAGLKGEAIPLAARVFAVVDVWDALSTGRSYSEHTWAFEEIIAHFRKEAGHSFDPRVVEKFLALFRDTNPLTKEKSMNTTNYNPTSQRSRTILELLAEMLSVQATNDVEARMRLDLKTRTFPSRAREVVTYFLTNTTTEVFLERRGGGGSLWYILWWFRTHARDEYEKVGKIALRAALDSRWPLFKAYENLVKIKELQPHLPPAPEHTSGQFESGGVSFFTKNKLVLGVNCLPKDQWTYSVQKGAQVYLWSTDKFVEIRVDGRSGLGFPELATEWVVMRRNRTGLPTYCRLPRRATSDEMDQLIDYIWEKADRRKKFPSDK